MAPRSATLMTTEYLRIGLVALLVSVPLTAAAQDSDYIVTSPRWGAAQAEAVAAAGGTVVFGHDGAGVAVVRSSAAGFLSRLRASTAISDVRQDAHVRWQRPDVGGTIEA